MLELNCYASGFWIVTSDYWDYRIHFAGFYSTIYKGKWQDYGKKVSYTKRCKSVARVQ